MNTSRVYPESVTAAMHRWKHKDGIVFIRTNTRIHFSEDDILLGTVYMTNPGSYRMRRHESWDMFYSGQGELETITGTDAPDTTMQNVIEVINTAYARTSFLRPKGYVSIYNISAIVEPDGEKIERYHHSVLEVMRGAGGDESRIFEPPVHEYRVFSQQCENSQFVLMGFLNGVFRDEVSRIRDWSQAHLHKLVYSEDSKGNYTHPFRWRLKPELKQQAIERLVSILTIKGEVQ